MRVWCFFPLGETRDRVEKVGWKIASSMVFIGFWLGAQFTINVIRYQASIVGPKPCAT